MRCTCERYFPASSKEQVLALVENLRASYAQRIEQLAWMTPATRKVALEKLAAFHPKIGYPDKWRDYAALAIVKGDAFGNDARAQRSSSGSASVKRLGEPDRPRRVGHDAADHQRLLQPHLQRGGVPGGHPAAAVLRSARGCGGQLRRHRRR